MNQSRPLSHVRHAIPTVTLLGAGVAISHLSQPQGELQWERWLLLAACLGGLCLAGAGAVAPRVALRRLGLKTALWPILAAGMAGAGRLMGIEVYSHVHVLALLSLAAAHLVGEVIASGPVPEKQPSWLLNVQWILAIAGVPWCGGLVSTPRLVEFLAGGALFLFWLAPGSRAARIHPPRTEGMRDVPDRLVPQPAHPGIRRLEG